MAETNQYLEKIKKLNTEIEVLQDFVIMAENKVDKQKTEIEVLQDFVIMAENKVDQQKTEIEVLQKEVDNLKKENKNLQAFINQSDKSKPHTLQQKLQTQYKVHP